MEVHYYPTLQIRKLRFLNKKLLFQYHNMSREAMCNHGMVHRLGFTIPGFSSFFFPTLDKKINYALPHFPHKRNGAPDEKRWCFLP